MDVFAEFEALCVHLSELKRHFLSGPIVDPLSQPAVFSLPVRAFCVLSHAAFEEFAEQMALHAMQASDERWLKTRQSNDSLLSLVGEYSKRTQEERELFDDAIDTELDFRSYDHLREKLHYARDQFSKKVYANQGFGPKYLLAILRPVGIDLKLDVRHTASLTSLTKARGDYAHRGRIPRVDSPEDVAEWVEDCIEICRGIATVVWGRAADFADPDCEDGSHI